MNDVRNRERNIAPEDTIRNDAFVEGTLIRGDKPLSTVQRVGAIIIGLFFLCFAAIFFWADGSVMIFGGLEDRGINAVLVPIGFLIASGTAYVGYRMVRSGLTGGRPRIGSVSR
jgi:hypothetical protein